MERDYSLDKLVEAFEEHSKIGMEHQKFVNEKFLEQNPGQELPSHMANPFDVARAFSVMSQEIQKIKEHLQLK